MYGGLETRDVFLLRMFFALMGKEFAYKETEEFAKGCKDFFVNRGTDACMIQFL